ncbi:MAG TPA: hypothetical protein VKD21_07140, partial [Acidimicrobiales bacterium]|nr:hypothetical protein [Acidimicrobiales bacterium]
MGREVRADPPTGTVTFLLADVEHPAVGTDRSEGIIDAAVTTHGGTRLEQLGRGAGAVAVFESATDAVAVARDVQRALMAATGQAPPTSRLRIGIHTGEADARAPNAYGG